MAKKIKAQKSPDEEEIEENGDEEEVVEPEEALEEAPAPEEAPAENEDQEAEEAVNPPAASSLSTITIEGDGTTPIIGVDGAVRTVERGVPIEVSDEEVAYLKVADLPFKKGKKS